MIDHDERRAALGDLIGAASAFDDVEITAIALVGVAHSGEVHYGTRSFRIDPRIDLGYLELVPYYSRLYASGVEGPWNERAVVIDEAIVAGAIAMLGVNAEYARLTPVISSSLVVVSEETVEGSVIGGVPSVYVRFALPSGETSRIVHRSVLDIVERAATEGTSITAALEALAAERDYRPSVLSTSLKSDFPYLVRTGLVRLDEVAGG